MFVWSLTTLRTLLRLQVLNLMRPVSLGVHFSLVVFMTTVQVGTEVDLTRVGIFPGVNDEARQGQRS